MRKKVLVPFDIEKAKNGAEVCTREGKKVRIISYDRCHEIYNIIALVFTDRNVEMFLSYTNKGEETLNETSPCDLFLVEYEDDKPQFKPFDKVLVRDGDNGTWMCDFFSHIEDDDSGYQYCCISTAWRECIPFEGNENLVGTKKSPE